jgi:NAD(P)H-nitrite reductase large subunit
MVEPSDTELQEMAQRLLGRNLDGEAGALLRSRLRNMTRVRTLLADWEARLGETAPMTITPVPVPIRDDGDGGN